MIYIELQSSSHRHYPETTMGKGPEKIATHTHTHTHTHTNTHTHTRTILKYASTQRFSQYSLLLYMPVMSWLLNE